MDKNAELVVLDQKQADQIARLFNISFNSAFLYGGAHPTTIKNIAPLFNQLSECLLSRVMLSLVINQDRLHVEELCADKSINVKRLLSHFAKIGINSITFERGIRAVDIEEFIKLSSDSNVMQPVEKIARSFQSGVFHGIRINYVRYGKITSDQAVVSSDTLSASGIAGSNNGPRTLSSNTLQQVEEMFTLASLIERPQSVASALAQAASSPDAARNAIKTLNDLRSEVEHSHPQNLELLLDAIYELKIDLAETIEVQKITGKILSLDNQVASQMNELTCDVILKLVKEEYCSGSISIKRLGQIIRRMLPDLSELKSILPQLKAILLSDGMSLPEYLELLRSLDLELETERLAGSLTDAAEGIGVSVHEIVEAIKTEPKDAARLIFLAAEIRNGSTNDDAQLSNMLTDYIERVSTGLALESPDIEKPQGGRVLRRILLELEGQLLDRLKTQGVEDTILLNVKKLLSDRFETIFDGASSQWMNCLLAADSDKAPENVTGRILNFIENQSQISRFQDSLTSALVSRGYKSGQIENFFKQLTLQVISGRKISLPRNALPSNLLLFLVNRELKQHLRYKTPFTTLMISIKSITIDGVKSSPSFEDHEYFLPQIFAIGKPLFRDIDMFGTPGTPDDTCLFAILTMTAMDGALIVKERVVNVVNGGVYKKNGTHVYLEIVVSVCEPEDTLTKDLSSYMELARRKHKSCDAAV